MVPKLKSVVMFPRDLDVTNKSQDTIARTVKPMTSKIISPNSMHCWKKGSIRHMRERQKISIPT